MKDKALLVIAGILGATGGVVAGILIRQPEINKLQSQVQCLQKDIEQLENVIEEQNAEIAEMIVNYRALKIYQILKRQHLRDSIQDKLICQYAANDYLSLLISCINPEIKMTKDEIHFYKTYTKMLSDDQIDADEIEILRPIILDKHSHEIKNLVECDPRPTLNKIKNYDWGGKGQRQKGLFGRAVKADDDGNNKAVAY